MVTLHWLMGNMCVRRRHGGYSQVLLVFVVNEDHVTSIGWADTVSRIPQSAMLRGFIGTDTKL